MKVLNRLKITAKGYFEKQAERILVKYKDLPKDVIFCIESYSQVLDEKDIMIRDQVKEIDELKRKLKEKEKAYQILERQYHNK